MKTHLSFLNTPPFDDLPARNSYQTQHSWAAPLVGALGDKGLRQLTWICLRCYFRTRCATLHASLASRSCWRDTEVRSKFTLGISSNDRWLLFRREPSGHLALIGIGKTVWKRISMSSKSYLNIHMGRVWPRNCGNPRRYAKSSGTAGCADVIEIYRSSLLALRSHMSFDEICSYKVSCNITCKIILLETEVWGFLLSPHLDAGRQSLPH